MVARRRRARSRARLLRGRGRGGAPLLALPRRPLSAEEPAALVPPRALCLKGQIMAEYAELQVTSNFSFLRGGSHPHELVAMAQALGHRAIAITDRNTLAGVVRAHAAAEDLHFRLVIGCRIDLADAPSLLCFPIDRAAYGRLSRLLTRGKRRAEKGQCHLTYADLLDHGAGQLLLALPPDDAIGDGFADFLLRFAGDFRGQAYLAAQHRYAGDDAKRLHRLASLAGRNGLPLVATNDVFYHTPKRRPLQD